MTADIIQARYDQLDSVAARFARSAHDNAELHKRITSCVQALQHGGWEGAGAAAFFSEMHSTIDPAMQRLAHALETAQFVTLEAKKILLAAEEDAARVFGGGASDGSGTSKQGLAGGGGGGGGWGSDETKGSWIDNIKKSDITLFKFDAKKHESSNPHELGFHYAVLDKDFYSKKADGSTQLGSVTATGMAKATGIHLESGAGLDSNRVGVYGEVNLGKVETNGVLGDEKLGLTGGVEAKGPSAEGFIGMDADKDIGGKIGVSLVSASGDVGGNVAGVNVGVHGEVGLKWELGFKLGAKSEIELPFVTLGFSLGKAKTGKAE